MRAPARYSNGAGCCRSRAYRSRCRRWRARFRRPSFGWPGKAAPCPFRAPRSRADTPSRGLRVHTRRRGRCRPRTAALPSPYYTHASSAGMSGRSPCAPGRESVIRTARDFRTFRPRHFLRTHSAPPAGPPPFRLRATCPRQVVFQATPPTRPRQGRNTPREAGVGRAGGSGGRGRLVIFEKR